MIVNLVRKASPDLAEAIMESVLSVSDTSINRAWQALVKMDSLAADKPSSEWLGANVQPLGFNESEGQGNPNNWHTLSSVWLRCSSLFLCQQWSAGYIEQMGLL